MISSPSVPFKKIGFIGLGVMGSGIAKNFAAKSGVPVAVWDLQPAAAEAARSYGADPAPSLQEMVQDADVIAVCLPSGAHLDKLWSGEEGLFSLLKAGQSFIDFGTSPVNLTRRLAAECESKGVFYADAPIARGREAAQRGTLSITVGASKETFATIRPLLELAGTDVLHCGDVGCGQVVKILNNMVLFENVVALSEALATAKANGLDPAILMEALRSGSADSYALRHHGEEAIWPGVFPKRAFSTLYALKDIGYAIDLANGAGLELRGAATTKKVLEDAVKHGYSDEYFPVLFNVVSRRSS